MYLILMFKYTSYWMTLTRGADTVNCKRKHQLALNGDLVWGVAVDLS